MRLDHLVMRHFMAYVMLMAPVLGLAGAASGQNSFAPGADASSGGAGWLPPMGDAPPYFGPGAEPSAGESDAFASEDGAEMQRVVAEFVEMQKGVREALFGDGLEPTLFYSVDLASSSDTVLTLESHHGETLIFVGDSVAMGQTIEPRDVSDTVRLEAVDLLRGQMIAGSGADVRQANLETVVFTVVERQGDDTEAEYELLMVTGFAEGPAVKKFGYPCRDINGFPVHWSLCDPCDPNGALCCYAYVALSQCEQIAYDAYEACLNLAESTAIACLLVAATAHFTCTLAGCGKYVWLGPTPLGWVVGGVCAGVCMAAYLVAADLCRDNYEDNAAQCRLDFLNNQRSCCSSHTPSP